MKRSSLIVTSMSAIAAVIVGYFGVQHLGRNTMFAVSGGMIAVGATVEIIQMRSKYKSQQTRLKQPSK